MKVFLSGSRALSRLNQQIRDRLEGITSQSFEIVIGDASGADKSLQTFLSDYGYSNVTVYCSGGRCRNNVGGWGVHNVDVPPGARGRDIYTQKDRAMAKEADYGFVLWDGRSPGSLENVIALLRGGKSALVYYSPEREFISVCSSNHLKQLLSRIGFEALEKIEKKIKLEKLLDDLDGGAQPELELPSYSGT